MKKLLIIITILLIFTGCSKDKIEPVSEENIQVAEVVEVEPVEIVEEVVPLRDPNLVQSPLSGNWVTKELIQKRPVVVMLDNHVKARPQAGLSEAEIVYEILAEGLITRYMAVFQANEPQEIGPVRSARSYFIDKALEYDPLYVHVGGSPQAFDDVVRLQMADMDGLASGAFWRTKHKKMPHNAYTSIENLRSEADRKGYRKEVEFESWSFNEEDIEIDGNTIEDVKFVYKEPSSGDSVGYFSEFKYNSEDKLFYRYVNGSPHKDENTEIHLSAKNVLIQVASHKIIDNQGRRDIDLVGKGEGYYLSDGKYKKINWIKSDRKSITKVLDLEGNEIKFNPGVTWVQIVSKDMELGLE